MLGTEVLAAPCLWRTGPRDSDCELAFAFRAAVELRAGRLNWGISNRYLDVPRDWSAGVVLVVDCLDTGREMGASGSLTELVPTAVPVFSDEAEFDAGLAGTSGSVKRLATRLCTAVGFKCMRD